MFVKHTICPVCGYTPDCASGINHNRRPKPDDLSICLACGAALVFTADLDLRKATEAEIASLPQKTLDTITRIQAARKDVVGNEIIDRMKKDKPN